MRVFVGYATSEGQTRKIARFAADHLVALGHSVELLALEDATDVDWSRFDAAVLAGSLHAGGYQKVLVEFARRQAGSLAQRETLFLAVSLSAAGDDPEDWKGLRAATAAFQEKTGWTPDTVEHVAGAFRFTEYSLLEGFIMRRIAAKKDPGIDTHADTEYTDWARLAEHIEGWCAGHSDSTEGDRG